jgi:hypothetical protein
MAPLASAALPGTATLELGRALMLAAGVTPWAAVAAALTEAGALAVAEADIEVVIVPVELAATGGVAVVVDEAVGEGDVLGGADISHGKFKYMSQMAIRRSRSKPRFTTSLARLDGMSWSKI